MNILFVVPDRFKYSCGVSVYVSELIKELLKRADCKIGLLPIAPSKKTSVDFKGLPNCLIIDGPTKYYWNPFYISSGWLDKIENTFGRPDIVHFHDIYYPFQSALSIEMHKRGWKYIVSLHGALQDAQQKRKFLKKMVGNLLFLKNFIKRSEAVHVLNEAEATSFMKRFAGVETFIVPNGVSMDMLSLDQPLANSRLFNINQNIIRVGFIGRIDVHHKGLDFLLRAIKLLQEQRPKVAFEFVFVGRASSEKDKNIFSRLISSLSDPSKVTLTGPIFGKAKWEILSTFDIFVHTSRYEGMPTSVIEAMAFCKPCLVTPGTNMQELILECNGGWGCAANAESIAKTLLSIESNRKEIIEKGINAKKYVLKHLVWDVIVDDYFNQVKRILEAKNDH